MAGSELPGLRVFLTKPFARFAASFGVSDEELWQAVHAECDADLGGGVFKYRLARAGEGSSGGARALIAIRRGQRAVYMFGFEKKDQANIKPGELKKYRRAAAIFLGLSEEEMTRLVRSKALREIRGTSEGDQNAGKDVQEQSDGGVARKHVGPARRRGDRR